jgi:asparagine synthase (glutamine-hydrolysing)
MCGVAALLRTPRGHAHRDVLAAMIRLVAHRGPDGEGLTLHDGRGDLVEGGDWRVGLAHRRLSILDLSPAGAQPMQRGRLWISFNGEIYNHVELRAELEREGATFRSHSDTEVILGAYERWGTDCFRRMKGMWGIVLVDGAARRVVASRDRLGIKPLYVAERDGTIAFVSEPKQLAPFLGRLSPHAPAVQAYLATGYEDQRASMLEGVTPLPPATWRAWSLDSGDIAGEGAYWEPERIVPVTADPDEAGVAFAAALRRSVHEHLRSDVPVGCALSGGLDSSAIAALVARESDAELHTFTATFPGEAIDERGHVDAVLATIRAVPHFVTPTAEGFLGELDRFVWHHDEPVGSLSQYAAWCIARLTRAEGVPVTLNGQGGDEVLGGYWQSYFAFLRTLARPSGLRRLLGHVAGTAFGGNPELLRQAPVMWRRYRARHAAASDAVDRILSMSPQERRVWEIRELYLPRLLKWDDRNFMAFSVEGRYPFLDHEVIETALTFTPRALYHRGWVKEPVRRGLRDVLPDAVLRRRTKLGFETPQERWLAGPMRAWLEETLPPDARVWRFAERPGAAAPRSEEETQRLFRLAMTERWLRVVCGA